MFQWARRLFQLTMDYGCFSGLAGLGILADWIRSDVSMY